MENIIIWGAGFQGEVLYEKLCKSENVNILAFGDNDIKKQGNCFKGKQVLNLNQIKSLSNVDYIIISSSFYEDEIYNQLSVATDIQVYKRKIVDTRCSIDISGWCNARCRWCATGIKNRHESCLMEYMSFEKFVEVYQHLKRTNMFHTYNELLLYSWGEPFLNPDYIKIIEYLDYNKQIFSISTNASRPQYIQNGEVYKYCKTVVFSMSGFSQNSYDKIHGFKIDVIKKNIRSIIENMRAHGFSGEAILSYHVYQFNEDEVKAASKFAESLNIKFSPVYAYFAGYDLAKNYLANTMSKEERNEAENSLVLKHVPNLLKDKPESYRCGLEHMISINVKGNLELCCGCDESAPDYEWGSIFKIESYSEWKKFRNKMLSCNTCKQCISLGIAYWFRNNPFYPENLYKENERNLKG